MSPMSEQRLKGGLVLWTRRRRRRFVERAYSPLFGDSALLFLLNDVARAVSHDTTSCWRARLHTHFARAAYYVYVTERVFWSLSKMAAARTLPTLGGPGPPCRFKFLYKAVSY